MGNGASTTQASDLMLSHTKPSVAVPVFAMICQISSQYCAMICTAGKVHFLQRLKCTAAGRSLLECHLPILLFGKRMYARLVTNCHSGNCSTCRWLEPYNQIGNFNSLLTTMHFVLNKQQKVVRILSKLISHVRMCRLVTARSTRIQFRLKK